ncbi:VPRE2 protein, partial [Polyodon spathula]|nr:VPRE2 protein [Polyodon spathula]
MNDFAGVFGNPVVIQSPPSEIKDGDTVRFPCSLKDGGMEDVVMFWYRQRDGQSPEYISREGKHYGKGFKERFIVEIDDSNNKLSLEIKPAHIEDSGVYYCVVLESTATESTHAAVQYLKII